MAHCLSLSSTGIDHFAIGVKRTTFMALFEEYFVADLSPDGTAKLGSLYYSPSASHL